MEETSLKDVFRYSIIGDRVERLKRSVLSKPELVVPWVGAGISASAGLPMWSSFLVNMSAGLGRRDQITAKRLIDGGFLDLAADFICAFPTVNMPDEMVSNFNHPGSANPILSRITKLGSQTLVTTNYDRLIETSVPSIIPLTPQSYRSEALKKQHCLLKVHGTIERPESWVLTRWQYARCYNADLIEDLRDFFRNRTVLFLGCSLRRDQYLEILKEIPEPERTKHFAVLCVDSDEEGKEKGELLGEIGIEVIPYRTTGEHSLVREVLDYIQPPVDQAMKWVRAALERQDLNRAVSLLSPWMHEPPTSGSSRLVADTIAHITEKWRLREERLRPSMFIEFSKAATEIDPTSSYAWRVRAEILEGLSQDSTHERDRLKELLNQESVQTSTIWPRTTNKALGEAYVAYRMGDTHRMELNLRALAANPPSKASSVRDRLAVFALRAKLGTTAPAVGLDAAKRLIPQLSDQARPFAYALIAYHVGEFDAAIASLTVLEKRWRASSTGKGLGFSLHLRALCLLGLEQYDQALIEIDRCHAAYVEPQRRLIRKFYKSTTPAELSYDMRALGSPELFALINFWRFLSEINGSRSRIQTSSIERTYEQLSVMSGEDRLLQAFAALILAIHPGVDRIVPGGMSEIQIHGLLDQFSKLWPGMLRDISTATSAISNSGLAPKWFDGVQQRLQDARITGKLKATDSNDHVPDSR